MTGGHGGSDANEHENEGDDELHHQSPEAVRLGELTAGAERHLGHLESGMGSAGGGLERLLSLTEEGGAI